MVAFLCGVVSFASTAVMVYSGLNLRRAVEIGIIVMIIGIAVMPSTRSLSYFMVASAIASIGAGLQPLLLTSTVLSGAKHGKSIPAFSSTLSLSLIIGPVYLSLLTHIPRVDLLTSLLGLVPITTLGLLAYMRASITHNVESTSKVGVRQMLNMLGNRGYLLGVILEISFTVPFAAFTTYGAILASLRGAGGTLVELLVSVFFLSSFSARALMTHTEGRAPSILVFVLSAIGLPIAALSTALYQIAISFVLLGLAHGLAYPLSVGFVAKSVNKETLAWANTLLSGISAGTLFIALPVLGFLAQAAGLQAVFLAPEPLVVALALAFYVALNGGAGRVAKAGLTAGSNS
ncbi:MAG: hypothetical protein QW688_02380 [Thermoprotei archaeon]